MAAGYSVHPAGLAPDESPDGPAHPPTQPTSSATALSATLPGGAGSSWPRRWLLIRSAGYASVMTLTVVVSNCEGPKKKNPRLEITDFHPGAVFGQDDAPLGGKGRGQLHFWVSNLGDDAVQIESIRPWPRMFV